MYPPKLFTESRLEVLLAAMREYSFATVVTADGGVPSVSHVPVTIDEGAGGAIKIRGHVVRTNPQWNAMAAGVPVVAIFQGPHSYVSPAWYRDAKTVPTWNYVVVHAHGRARLLDEPGLRASLSELVELHERPAADPWRLDSLSADDVDKMMRGIVGFEILVDRLDGRLKLSQNRTAGDQWRVMEQLGSSADPTTREVARWMTRVLDANGTVDVPAGKP